MAGMTDNLADEIYEATGMVLGAQQAEALTRFVRKREAAAARVGMKIAADACAKLRANIQNEADHAPTAQLETLLSAAACAIEEAEAMLFLLRGAEQ